MLTIKNLSFAWPGEEPFLAIDHFEIKEGERLFLKGRSGSGKSTLLSLISGLLLPQKGEISLLGADVNRLSAAARDTMRGDHIGFIFQQFNLIPYLSVQENILMPLKFSQRRSEKVGADPAEEARRLLEELRLDVSPDKRADSLSMGQQQRVAAARALLGGPEILIADEPTSALDEETGEDFMTLLLKECERCRCALLFVSHDSRWQRHFADTVALEDIKS